MEKIWRKSVQITKTFCDSMVVQNVCKLFRKNTKKQGVMSFLNLKELLRKLVRLVQIISKDYWFFFIANLRIVGSNPTLANTFLSRNVRDRPEIMFEFEGRKGLENICEHQSLKMSKF